MAIRVAISLVIALSYFIAFSYSARDVQAQEMRLLAQEAKAPQVSKGNGGLDKIVLGDANKGPSAEVYLYGGHVTSWKSDKGEELLFLSKKSFFEPPKPIRGGIPICFPQFSGLGDLPSHGFARNRVWAIDTNAPPAPSPCKASVDLILKSTEDDVKMWPHRFEFRLRVALGPKGELVLTSRVKNTDQNPCSFTFAYHTYFSVSDIGKVLIEGLETLEYLDNSNNRTRATDKSDAVVINSNVDRVYLNTPPKIEIFDSEKKRKFVVQKEGLPEAVVWNPWAEKAAKMPDFEAEEYKQMVCVEAAAIDKPVTLKPDEEWTGKVELSALDS